MNSPKKHIHDKLAPFWAIGLFILGGTGVATTWIKTGTFWNGYVLDMVGPAWNYNCGKGVSVKSE